MDKYLEIIDEEINAGPYKADWKSIGKWQVPNWFLESKFGIFIHWGLYSIPANSNEWYSRNMYIKGMPAYEHHIKKYGPQNEFGYKDFIPMFTANNFNLLEWAKLFKKSGARYVFPVAEHHDGFQMYQSDVSKWNSYEMGPKRDILGELKKAIESEGLEFCTSTHRAEHWFFMGHGKEFDSDIKEPMVRGDFYWPAMPEPDNQALYSEPYPTEEFLNDWLVRTCEIIDKYEPSLLYFDWWIQHDAFKEHFKKLVAYYYNQGIKWGKKVAVCYKHDAMMFGSGIVEIERGAFSDVKPYPWQTDTAVARNSWCYTDSLDYKSSREIICTLIDVVSKNGNLLLNIGPKGDGSIPEGDKKILEDIGAWMSVNEESIIGSKVWRKAKEGPTLDLEGQFQDGSEKTYTCEDFRFTVNNGYIYVFSMSYPKEGKIVIKSLKKSKDQNIPEFHGIIEDVSILGYDEKINYKITYEGLEFKTSTVRSEFPIVIKVKIK